ncbi:MAG: hypothetical protein ACTJIB_07545 [Pseudoalteromonas prydzensis]|uniref:Uncharacterized protein n=1 Tax=Pseudoalteromonas prydzensis TaxID=182141 RepID=A0ABR9FSG8_9GAMM|nr:hypothetical protein [Pseudoalteromonas prydzensis]MBE0459747.1 hypothetical protein [Pseudoalteromonas prydzensis]
MSSNKTTLVKKEKLVVNSNQKAQLSDYELNKVALRIEEEVNASQNKKATVKIFEVE